MLIEEDYCDYETCVALKKLGFDNLVDWYFNEEKVLYHHSQDIEIHISQELVYMMPRSG